VSQIQEYQQGRKANYVIRPEEPSITKLTFLTEALNAVALPGSVDLISHLLQALSCVVQTFSPLQADVNYTEQLLMSAIDAVASKVTVWLTSTESRIKAEAEHL
jgi:U3 small nucleolar RNA-associated protein 10